MSSNSINSLNECKDISTLHKFICERGEKPFKFSIATCGGRRITSGQKESICLNDLFKRVKQLCEEQSYKQLEKNTKEIMEIVRELKRIDLEFSTDSLLKTEKKNKIQALLTRIRQFFGNLFFKRKEFQNDLYVKLLNEIMKADFSSLEQMRKADEIVKGSGSDDEKGQKLDTLSAETEETVKRAGENLKEILKNNISFDFLVQILKKYYEEDLVKFLLIIDAAITDNPTLTGSEKIKLLIKLDKALFPDADRTKKTSDEEIAAIQEEYDKAKQKENDFKIIVELTGNYYKKMKEIYRNNFLYGINRVAANNFHYSIFDDQKCLTVYLDNLMSKTDHELPKEFLEPMVDFLDPQCATQKKRKECAKFFGRVDSLESRIVQSAQGQPLSSIYKLIEDVAERRQKGKLYLDAYIISHPDDLPFFGQKGTLFIAEDKDIDFLSKIKEKYFGLQIYTTGVDFSKVEDKVKAISGGASASRFQHWLTETL